MKKLRYTQHALQRLGERKILRCWVIATAATRPTCYGHHAIFVLTAEQLHQRFGQPFSDGLRVVVDCRHSRVITVHWFVGALP